MPTLTLQFKDTNLSDYRLDKGSSLIIGRRETSTVVIDNLAVSGTHAKVDMLEDGCLLTDLQSKNGTFVNGKLVTSHWLRPGDVVMIGKHTLVFKLDKGEETPAESQADMDNKTMVLDTNDYKALVDKGSATKPPSSTGAAPPPRKEPLGILSFLKGGEGEVSLMKKLVKIGKDDSNDIVVGGFLMGGTAATISRRPNGYVISFVEGMTKPKVNGTTVKDSVILKEFDKIEIGSIMMEFILKD
jgi:pSer/pThr/pTyr-binding forkhead associated (FHA) protein